MKKYLKNLLHFVDNCDNIGNNRREKLIILYRIQILI